MTNQFNGEALLAAVSSYDVRTPPMDFLAAVALGRVHGVAAERKFGYSQVLVSGSAYTVWPLASTITFPTTADTLTITSSDTNDTAAGTGARTVRVFGLLAAADQDDGIDWGEGYEDVALAGTSAANTTKNFYRVNRVVVTTVGTYGGSNIGNITVKHDAGNTDIAYVPATTGITQQLVYTVPAGKTVVAWAVNNSPESTKSLNIYYRTRASADDVTVPYSPVLQVGNTFGASSTNQTQLFSRTILRAKTDLEVRAQVSSGGTTDKLSLGIQFALFDNTVWGLT